MNSPHMIQMNSSGLIFGPVATLAISTVLMAATTAHSVSPNSIDAKTAEKM
jgi:hypothetical protein